MLGVAEALVAGYGAGVAAERRGAGDHARHHGLAGRPPPLGSPTRTPREALVSTARRRRSPSVVILLLPLLLPNALLTIYIFIGLSTMVVAGLSLLMGFAGQVSLGQAAFYAIGAYTAGLLARDLNVPPLLALLVAPAAAAAIA